MKDLQQLINDLKLLTAELRDPLQGDPWILQQNFQSLAALTIEEAYEFAESVAEKDYAASCDELGDLLLHVFLYAQLANELSQFNLEAIIQTILDKQSRRRIHFKTPDQMSASEALKLWDQEKQKEKKQTQVDNGILSSISKKIPGLLRAEKLQVQAATVGFDWNTPAPIYQKIDEELLEFQHAVTSDDNDHMEEELGDVLFAVVNLARHYKINPETALQRTNRKFIYRFEQMEKILAQRNKKMTDCDLSELDKVWEEVKTKK